MIENRHLYLHTQIWLKIAICSNKLIFRYASMLNNPSPLKRTSLISTALRPDNIEHIENLTIGIVRQLCTDSVYQRAKIFRVKTSALISTNVDKIANSIVGEFRSALIYDQSIRWGASEQQAPFSLVTISVFCSCKYFSKETAHNGLCCKHIIGQLRRVLYLSW